MFKQILFGFHFSSYDNAMLASLKHTNDYSKDNYRSRHRNSNGNLQKIEPLQLPSKLYNGMKSVAKDFWRDLPNDKALYSLTMTFGTVFGLICGMATASTAGFIASGALGFTAGGAEHYVERRLFHDDYRKKKEEFERKEHARKMHENLKLRRKNGA